MRCLPGSERDDAANRIVGRNTHGHAVAGDDLDAEAAHSAAQLGQHFMARVTLHTIEPPAVNCHYRSLHVDQIVFAQTGAYSFPSGASEKLLAIIVPQTASPRPIFAPRLPPAASSRRSPHQSNAMAPRSSPSLDRASPFSTI